VGFTTEPLAARHTGLQLTPAEPQEPAASSSPERDAGRRAPVTRGAILALGVQAMRSGMCVQFL